MSTEIPPINLLYRVELEDKTNLEEDRKFRHIVHLDIPEKVLEDTFKIRVNHIHESHWPAAVIFIALVFGFCFFMALCFGVLGCCGSAEAGPAYLVGDYTQEELEALTAVQNAFQCAGFPYSGVAVNFVHSPDAHFKGTTWAEWRLPGVPARNEAEGYRGYYDQVWHMVFIRRYGEAEPLLHDLLIHEILHSLGYHHDTPQAAEKMKEAQLLVEACM